LLGSEGSTQNGCWKYLQQKTTERESGEKAILCWNRFSLFGLVCYGECDASSSFCFYSSFKLVFTHTIIYHHYQTLHNKIQKMFYDCELNFN